MMSKAILAAVSLFLAAEGYSLLTAPASLVREAMVKAGKMEAGQTRQPA